MTMIKLVLLLTKLGIHLMKWLTPWGYGILRNESPDMRKPVIRFGWLSYIEVETTLELIRSLSDSSNKPMSVILQYPYVAESLLGLNHWRQSLIRKVLPPSPCLHRFDVAGILSEQESWRRCWIVSEITSYWCLVPPHSHPQGSCTMVLLIAPFRSVLRSVSSLMKKNPEGRDCDFDYQQHQVQCPSGSKTRSFTNQYIGLLSSRGRLHKR